MIIIQEEELFGSDSDRSGLSLFLFALEGGESGDQDAQIQTPEGRSQID